MITFRVEVLEYGDPIETRKVDIKGLLDMAKGFNTGKYLYEPGDIIKMELRDGPIYGTVIGHLHNDIFVNWHHPCPFTAVISPDSVEMHYSAYQQRIDKAQECLNILK